jgi:lipoprotein-anchoring transpeptidase ErfK/SrfK
LLLSDLVCIHDGKVKMNITQAMKSRSIARHTPKGSGSSFAKKITAAVLISLGLIIFLPVFLSFSAYGYLEALEIILPGVKVGGVTVEGLAVHEAVAKIDRNFNQSSSIIVVDTLDPDRNWVVTPSEFGLSVDAQASAERAYAAGRESGVAAGVEQMLSEGWEGDPVVSFDPAAARASLETWAKRVNVPVIEGTLNLEGGTIRQIAGQAGKRLDIEASLALIAADPYGILLDYQIVPLVMVPVEPHIGDVSEPAAVVESYIGSGLILRAYDPVMDEWFTWAPDRETIASWLDIERGQSEYSVKLVEERVEEYVLNLNTGLGEERYFDVDEAMESAIQGLQSGQQEPLRVYYRPMPYIVQRPQTLTSLGAQIGMPFWKLIEANPQLAGRNPWVGETITLPAKDAMLTLPVIMNKRIVINISEQHMWVYEDGELIKDHVISTGMAESPTMPGIFQVQSHFENAYASNWDLWMPYFLGIYDAVPGFENGIHGLPVLSNGVRLWASVLGQPASYGCIILDLEASEELYTWAEDGVVVEIQR